MPAEQPQAQNYEGFQLDPYALYGETHRSDHCGAGAIGLLVACELAIKDVSVLILEREAAPVTPWKNNIDYSRWKDFCLPRPAYVPGATTLGHIENVLNERAQARGVRVLKGKGVTHFDDNGEMAEYSSQGGWNPMYITAGPMHIYAVDHSTSFDRSQPVTREHFPSVLRRISGTGVTVNKIILASSFTDRSKQAAQYKKCRVLLAGDSAHIHPPFGAQGLNTGIGDAINLGWKLAATIRGYASPGLINTYHQERFAVAAKVLEWVRAQIVTFTPR